MEEVEREGKREVEGGKEGDGREKWKKNMEQGVGRGYWKRVLEELRNYQGFFTFHEVSEEKEVMKWLIGE